MSDFRPHDPRHRLIAEYTALGKKPDAIASELGFAVGYVRAIQSSPLFKNEVASLQAENKRATLKVFAERLAEEALPSLNALAEIRDGGAKDADRVNAADKLIGRTLDLYTPRDKRNAPPTKRIIIEGTDLTTLLEAARESTSDPILIEAPAQPSEPEGWNPVDLDTLEGQDEFKRW